MATRRSHVELSRSAYPVSNGQTLHRLSREGREELRAQWRGLWSSAVVMCLGSCKPDIVFPVRKLGPSAERGLKWFGYEFHMPDSGLCYKYPLRDMILTWRGF